MGRKEIRELTQMMKSKDPCKELLSQIKIGSNADIETLQYWNAILSGDNDGYEKLARHLCKQRGIDPDAYYNLIAQEMNH